MAEVEGRDRRRAHALAELEAAWRTADAARIRPKARSRPSPPSSAAEEAGRRAAEARIEDTRHRLGRAQRRRWTPPRPTAPRWTRAPDPKVVEAKDRFDAALTRLREARAALEAAEAAHAKASDEEITARDQARKAEDQLGRLKTEARGLAQLTAVRPRARYRRRWTR